MNAVYPRRKYDKGDRRNKHVHNKPEPVIVYEGGNPKRPVGKCPSGMSSDLLEQLLNEAIPVANQDPDVDYLKKIYVVHKGVIYEGNSSDRGTTYHGYPYAGRLSSGIVDELRLMARQNDCLVEFERWVQKYIVMHGR